MEAVGHMSKICVAEEAWLKLEPGLVSRRDTAPAQSWLPTHPKHTLTRLSSRESLEGALAPLARPGSSPKLTSTMSLAAVAELAPNPGVPHIQERTSS